MPKKSAPKTAPPAAAEAAPEASPKSERPGFFDQVRKLPEQRWDDHRIYIYRRWPRTSSFDAPHYLEIVRQPIDEEWLLDHHGSGRYGLRLNSNQGTVATHVCEVQDLRRPPRVNPEEVIDCPENARYFQLWPPATKEKPSGDASAAAVKEIGALAREAQRRPVVDTDLANLYLKTAEARDQLVRDLSEGRKEPGAEKQLDLIDHVMELVERLTQRQATPAPVTQDPLAIAERVVKLQAALRGDSAGVAPLEQLEQAVKIFERIKGLFPETEYAPEMQAAASPWAEFVRAFAPGLGQMLAPIGTVLAQYLLTKLSAGAPASGAAGAAPLPAPAPALSAATPHQDITEKTPTPDRSTQRPPQPATEDAGPLTAIQQVGQEITAIGRDAVLAFQIGISGDSFADALARKQGEPAYDRIAAIGKENIMAAIRAHPAYAEHLAPRLAQIESFVDEFLSYGEEEPPEDPQAGKPN